METSNGKMIVIEIAFGRLKTVMLYKNGFQHGALLRLGRTSRSEPTRSSSTCAGADRGECMGVLSPRGLSHRADSICQRRAGPGCGPDGWTPLQRPPSQVRHYRPQYHREHPRNDLPMSQ